MLVLAACEMLAICAGAAEDASTSGEQPFELLKAFLESEVGGLCEMHFSFGVHGFGSGAVFTVEFGHHI